MKQEVWKAFKRVALSENKGPDRSGSAAQQDRILSALIIDSPWVPGFVGISHLDYFTLPEQWMRANLYVEDRFPDIIFLPGFWVEYGMATEPSAFGCKITWRKESPPSIHPTLRDISDASQLKVPNPAEDGLMPLVLNLYRHLEKNLR